MLVKMNCENGGGSLSGTLTKLTTSTTSLSYTLQKDYPFVCVWSVRGSTPIQNWHATYTRNGVSYECPYENETDGTYNGVVSYYFDAKAGDVVSYEATSGLFAIE